MPDTMKKGRRNMNCERVRIIKCGESVEMTRRHEAKKISWIDGDREGRGVVCLALVEAECE